MGVLLDYNIFRKDQARYLEQLGEKKVIVTFSGGRDSTVILHFMDQIRREFDFEIEAHGVANPVHVYSGEDKEKITEYWKRRDIDIIWHYLEKDNDEYLESLLEGGQSPCVQCSDSKKVNLMEYLKVNEENFENLAIVLGYSLWDLSSALIEHILRSEFGGGDKGSFQGKSIKERFLEVSQRFYPLIKMENGISFYKPLVFYNDRDIEAVIERENIPVLTTQCRYKNYRPKRILSEYYKLYQLNFSYEKLLDFARKNLELPDAEVYEKSLIGDFVNNFI